MASVDLEHAYQYRHASAFAGAPTGESQQIILAPDREFRFDAEILDVELFGSGLLSLSEIVRSNFAHPTTALLDPVVTCAKDCVRFEGFSGCCGIYAHAKFLNSMFKRTEFAYGTTNVDFNDAFRNGLATMRHGQACSLQVREDAIQLTNRDTELVEKKVKLPLRWLRGFCEIQTMLSRVEHCMTCPSRKVRKFILNLPRNAARDAPMWATPSGKGLRLSMRESSRAVPVIGTDRLRLLDHLLRSHDGSISVGRIPGEWTSTWFCDFGHLQFLFVLSPGLYRGFSGEGQVLTRLADASWKNAIDQVRNALNWEHKIDPKAVADKLNLPEKEIHNSLAALASRGVLGYDLWEQQYFYRVLPFNSSLVETFHPRLTAARKILAENRIEPLQGNHSAAQWLVKGDRTQYIVELDEKFSKCTCPWFSKHKESRGPCKHILAAMISADEL